MSSGAPIEAFWSGEVFQPVNAYWARRADKQFVKGEIYRLVDQPERSHKSHAHYFASVENAWQNLPPLMAERFSSADALRKYCLIKAGFCTSESIVCPSHADALRVESFVRSADAFSLIIVKKNIVTRYVAKSQSYRAMGKAEFAASKEKVLDVLAELIGVTGNELRAAEPSQRDYMGCG